MDERAMTSGIVPVRHPSYMPGVVKLPRRFEKAALGDPRTAKHRKVSVCGEPLHMRQGISARLDDLMTAIMWVKQELILLRQHDILLKRQFFDIHDSILSLQTPRRLASALGSSSSSLSNSLNVNGDCEHSYSLSSSLNVTSMSRLARTPSSLSLSSLSSSPASSPFIAKKHRTPSSHSNGFTKAASPDFRIAPIYVRSSSSATVLNNNNTTDDNSDDTDGDDTFEENYYRPRTSSMKTSRDLAALARRRGSKDLI